MKCKQSRLTWVRAKIVKRTNFGSEFPFQSRFCNIQSVRKHRLILIVFLLGGVFVTLWFLADSTNEPTYKGRNLTEWMRAWKRSDPTAAQRKEAEDAIRSMGTNAVPHFVRWITYKTPAWKLKLYGVANPLLQRLNSDWVLHDELANIYGAGHIGFAILGQEGVSAIPALSEIMNQSNLLAAASLGYIGKDALPSLMAGLTNDNQEIRANALLYGIAELGTNARPAVPFLIERLKDADRGERFRAVTVLGHLRLQPETVVPALIEFLHDSDAIIRQAAAASLGSYEQEAVSAVPDLTDLLTDKEKSVRETSTNSLRVISTNTVIPELRIR